MGLRATVQKTTSGQSAKTPVFDAAPRPFDQAPVQCHRDERQRERRQQFKQTPSAAEYRARRVRAMDTLRRERRQQMFVERRGQVLEEQQNLGMTRNQWQQFVNRQTENTNREMRAMRAHGANARDIQPAEEELASYLYRRTLDRRTIDGRPLADLRLANEAVNNTRETLSVGKGNVDRDIQRSNHQSTRLTEAGREMADQIARDAGANNPREYGRISAATAACMRAGNCGEHANVATHIMAGQMPHNSGDVHQVQSEDFDHVWSEWRRPGQAISENIVMDAWGEGPAIQREDANFAGDSQQIRSNYSYDAETGNEASGATRALQNRILRDPNAHQFFQNSMARMNAANFQYHGGVYPPLSVLSGEFLNRTNNQHIGAPDFTKEIMMAGAGRALGSNVRQATAMAWRRLGRR